MPNVYSIQMSDSELCCRIWSENANTTEMARNKCRPFRNIVAEKNIYKKTVVLKTETKSQLWLNVRLQSCLEHTDSVWIKVDTPSRIIFTAVVSWWTKERIMSMGNFPGLSHSFDFLLVASYSWFHEKDCIQ